MIDNIFSLWKITKNVPGVFNNESFGNFDIYTRKVNWFMTSCTPIFKNALLG